MATAVIDVTRKNGAWRYRVRYGNNVAESGATWLDKDECRRQAEAHAREIVRDILASESYDYEVPDE